MSRWTHIEFVCCNGVVAVRNGNHTIVECNDPKDKDVAYSLTWQAKSGLAHFNRFIMPIIRNYNYASIGNSMVSVQPLSMPPPLITHIVNGWARSIGAAGIIAMTNGIYDGTDFYIVGEAAIGRRKYLTNASKALVLEAIDIFNKGFDDAV